MTALENASAIGCRCDVCGSEEWLSRQAWEAGWMLPRWSRRRSPDGAWEDLCMACVARLFVPGGWADRPAGAQETTR